MSVTIDPGNDNLGFKITCDECTAVMMFSTINDVLYWLPAHLLPGHAKQSSTAAETPADTPADDSQTRT